MPTMTIKTIPAYSFQDPETITFDLSSIGHILHTKNSKGLHFKHTGYPAQYLSDFTQTITYIPYQIIIE